jgi:broad specificity phosphatase PhoE
MPLSVSLIRHAEKQLADEPPYSVTIDGIRDPESLTPRGWQRAGALIALFVPRTNRQGEGVLPTPSHLFASELGPHSQSRRPQETLQPLSARLGLPIDEHFVQDDLDDLVGAILACDGHVLVAWEHKRIPLIANRFTRDASAVPQAWPDDRYDVVWVLEPVPNNGRFGLRQVPQLLLAGDRADVISSGAAHSSSPSPL